MKNVKFLGIIALVAVMVFSMASCLSLGGGSGGGSDSGNGSGGNAEWPGDDVWAGYGLSGLQPPPGKDQFAIMTIMGTYVVSVEGAKAEYDNLVAQIRGMSGVTVAVAETTNRDGTSIGFLSSTGHQVGVVMTTGRDGAVAIQVSQK